MPAVRHIHLAEFAESRDEAAFAKVVEEFAGLVFTSARRRTGDRDLAEEVAQNVFAIAARKARKLSAHPALTAWFYTTIKLEAAKALRSRQRHNRRIAALAEEMNSRAATNTSDTMSAEEQENWRDALPLLDESLDRLSPAEREILLGRFFEERSFKEIAASSGSSEAACKMRLKRALGKLNRWLTRRGVTLSAGALATGLAAEFAKGAPPALAAALPANALAASSGVSTATALTNTLNTMSTIKSASLAAAAVLVIGSIPVAIQYSQADNLRNRISDLEERHAALATGPRPPGDSLDAAVDIAAGDNTAGDKPVRKFLAALDQPLDADAFITEMVAAVMSRDTGQMMRVMLPLAKLTNEEGARLLAAVKASEKSPQMKQIGMQMLSMMLSQPEEGPGDAMDRNLGNGVDARNVAFTLREWAKNDADAAIAWFHARRSEGKLVGKGVDDHPEMHLLAGLVGGVAETDPARAMALLDGYDGQMRDLAVGDLATTLAAGDAASRKLAAELVAAMESGDQRIMAAQSTVAGLSHQGKRDEALEFIHAAGLDDQGKAMALVAAAFTDGKNPSSTWQEKVAWAMVNAPESARDELVGEIAHRGAIANPAEASAWVDLLPEGGQRDAGLAAEANSLTQNGQIEKALQRVRAIGDANKREDSIRRAFVWLNHSSPAAAARVAEEHGYQLDEILGR